MMGFIDAQRSHGHAVESICRVLRQQGCQIAARTYRSWKQTGRPVAARTVSDALVVDAVRQVAWATGVRRLTPEGLYGRRKMTAYLRRTLVPAASAGSVDRAMRLLGLAGVRRDKTTPATIPAKDGIRAGDLLNRDFTAPAPNHIWVSDFTYVRTWAGFTYVAFVVDVFAQKIVAWHAATSKATDLVMIPLRMALWARDREGHRPAPGQLICHSDAGSQGGFNWSSQHLVVGGGAWVWVSGRSRFVSTGGRSRRRGGLRSPGGRIGSGSGRRSLTA
jgi:putative transposase